MRLFIIALTILAPVFAHAADKTTRHSLALPSGPLAFTAVVETIKLANPKGEAQAEIVATAFLRDPAPGEAARPVTFAFNGGPGAASAWLDVGAIGPWRVPVRFVPGQDAALVDNAETWLGFTDLVFIDPPGTGYSRALVTGDAAKPFSTVDGDIDTLAVVVRRWLEAHDRLVSPKFVVGESYGGFRAPRLARTLQNAQGVGVNGLVLISPVLDFNGFQAPYNPSRWAAAIPALTAAHRRATSRAEVAVGLVLARTDYMGYRLGGFPDAAATARLVARTAGLTGLPLDVVQRHTGRIDTFTALREREPGAVASPYDVTVSVPDAFPERTFGSAPDPVLDGLRAPVTAAMLTAYRRMEWQPEGAPNRQYELLSDGVNRGWDYGRNNVRPEAMTALRQYLALDGTARVLVEHGLYDLVTPYFANALLLDQVPRVGAPGRLSLQAHAGGHMFYLDDASRVALRDEAAGLVRAALDARKSLGRVVPE